jgi:phage terminase large subunit GpA-like protein
MTSDCTAPSCLIADDIASIFRPATKADPATWIEESCPNYSLGATPYWRGLLADLNNPRYSSFAVLKSAQIGFSALLTNIIGYHAANDPGTGMLAMPTQPTGEEFLRNTVTPALKDMKGVVVRDARKSEVKLNASTVYLASFANSKSLKSKPCRYTYSDEISEAEANVEGEGSPLAQLEARTIRYSKTRKMIAGSTPRHANDHISRLWNEANDRRTYHVPCPHCNHFQALKFDNLKWPDRKEGQSHAQQAGEIEANPESVYYQCNNTSCNAHWTEQDKQVAVAQGMWISETQSIRDGRVVGQRPVGSKVAYKINSLYSTWFSFARLAATFLQSVDNPHSRKSFLSQYLGELPQPRELTPVIVGGISLANQEVLQARQANIQPGTVAPWVGILAMGIDVQGDRYYHVTRGFGAVRSHLVSSGVCGSEAELLVLINKTYPIAGTTQTLGIARATMDMGGTIDTATGTTAKQKAFAFAKRAGPLLVPIKGHDNGRQPWICDVDATFNQPYIAMLSRLIYDQIFDLRLEKLWFANAAPDPNWITHMDAVIPQVDPTTGERSYKFMTDRHDLWDCEAMCFTGAKALLAESPLPDEAELERIRTTPQRQSQAIDHYQLAHQLLPKVNKRWSA